MSAIRKRLRIMYTLTLDRSCGWILLFLRKLWWARRLLLLPKKMWFLTVTERVRKHLWIRKLLLFCPRSKEAPATLPASIPAVTIISVSAGKTGSLIISLSTDLTLIIHSDLMIPHREDKQIRNPFLSMQLNR